MTLIPNKPRILNAAALTLIFGGGIWLLAYLLLPVDTVGPETAIRITMGTAILGYTLSLLGRTYGTPETRRALTARASMWQGSAVGLLGLYASSGIFFDWPMTVGFGVLLVAIVLGYLGARAERRIVAQC